MANVFDEYAEEKIMEKDKITITKLLKNGVSVELLANSFTSLSKECIQELKDRLEMEAVV